MKLLSCHDGELHCDAPPMPIDDDMIAEMQRLANDIEIRPQCAAALTQFLSDAYGRPLTDPQRVYWIAKPAVDADATAEIETGADPERRPRGRPRGS